ncbi:hypothetical protein Tco_0940606 [Tanacetum coccineum]|uniref:Uncharacterized protein n=1 Tax=Tanacetum coccineum TaxID=301880 RepID=A0ABQ5DR39_9ASTR
MGSAIPLNRLAQLLCLLNCIAMDYGNKLYFFRDCGADNILWKGNAGAGKHNLEKEKLKIPIILEKETEAQRKGAIGLRGQSHYVEAAFYLSDLSDLHFSARDELLFLVASLEIIERDGLINQRSSLESAFELFSTRMEATQDEQARVLGNRVAELDAQLLEMVAYLDKEFYPRFLTAISERRWILTHELKLVILKCLQSPEYCHALRMDIGCVVNKGIQDGLRAGVDHGKAGRDLSVIEAYDPSAEAKYVEAVNALGTVDFSLLSKLKSMKDASIVNLMDSLCLEGPLSEITRVEDLQPSSEQLRLPIHRPEDNVVLSETSLSSSLQVVHSRVQRVNGEIMEKRLSLTDVMAPLAEPLSSQSLIGEASTSAASTTTEPITTLSTTLASSDVIPPLATSNDQALDMEPNDEDPPAVTFEREELVPSPE